MKSAQEVTELIEQQLARISQVELVECIRPLLVTPDWNIEYGTTDSRIRLFPAGSRLSTSHLKLLLHIVKKVSGPPIHRAPVY